MSLLEEVEIRENNKKKEQCKNVIKLKNKHCLKDRLL
jgi:hypothetical protein